MSRSIVRAWLRFTVSKSFYTSEIIGTHFVKSDACRRVCGLLTMTEHTMHVYVCSVLYTGM